jgi:UDP-glucose 4-epimerase
MNAPPHLRSSDLSDPGAPMRPMSIETSDQARNSRSSRLQILLTTTPQGYLLIALAVLIFIVSLLPYVSNHRASIGASSPSDFNDSQSGFINKNDAGPHKKAHVFVKPGNIRDKNRGDASEMTSDANQEGVPPKIGTVSLSPAEFRDVRLAHPNESVLLTGGLGFIGSHVAELLLHRGFKVTILDDESNGHNHNRFCREMVPNDITIVGDLPDIPTEIESEGEEVMYFTHVVHLAAAISVAESMNDPDKYERINFGGSQKVLDWIVGYNQQVSALLKSGQKTTGEPTLIRKIVAASSAAIYGDPDPSLLPLRESAPYGGLSPYADTKYRMEGLMNGFVQSQNSFNQGKEPAEFIPAASATALRFFNVYGPRQDPKNPYSGVISLFLEMASTNKDITILGDGLMTRDFVYVKDVARAVVMNLLHEKEGENNGSFSVYNVCTGKSITINTLATQVKDSMGASSNIVHLDPRAGDIRDSRCNPGGAAEGVAFLAAVTQEDGLEKTANWFREQNGSRELMERQNGGVSGRRLEEQFYPELI